MIHVSCRLAPYSETEALMVRHAAQTIDHDGVLIRESFGPACWVKREHPAVVNLEHDSEETVGHVTNLVAFEDGWWYCDFVILDERPAVLERLEVGKRVSIGARSIAADRDDDLNIVRHTLAELQEVTLIEPDKQALAGYLGAVILSVRRSKPKPKRATVQPPPARRVEGELVETHGPIRRTGLSTILGLR